MMEIKSQVKEVEKLIERAEALAGQARVKMSLAKMEARDTWQSFEKSFLEIASELKTLKRKAQNKLEYTELEWHLAMMELRDRLDEISKQLQPFLDDLKKAKGQIDHARVQANLAKLELREEIEAKHKELRRVYKTKVVPVLKETIKQLKEKLSLLEQKL